ncbi:type VII secretion system-associated protein [Streptomyces sp. NPDC088116]|uniref:type VII secretion system-associated protein n=1 Tax=Streptomyces sp. NPDC088116 TaxID=3365825 RepID=UPI0038277B8F
MAENTPTVNVNKAWMQKFLDDDIKPFRKAIAAIREDGEAPASDLKAPAVGNLLAGNGAKTAAGFHDGQKVPLAIGLMAADEGERTNGAYVIKSLNAVLEQLEEILKMQSELFEEMEANLEDSIEKMFKTQDDSLEKIDGKKFIDFFEDVDDVLSEGTGGSGGGDDEDED